MGTLLIILGIVVALALVVGLTFWWFNRKNIEKAFDAIIAAFVAHALKQGDAFEEVTKQRIVAKLQRAIKFIQNIDIIRTNQPDFPAEPVKRE